MAQSASPADGLSYFGDRMMPACPRGVPPPRPFLKSLISFWRLLLYLITPLLHDFMKFRDEAEIYSCLRWGVTMLISFIPRDLFIGLAMRFYGAPGHYGRLLEERAAYSRMMRTPP